VATARAVVSEAIIESGSGGPYAALAAIRCCFGWALPSRFRRLATDLLPVVGERY